MAADQKKIAFKWLDQSSLLDRRPDWSSLLRAIYFSAVTANTEYAWRQQLCLTNYLLNLYKWRKFRVSWKKHRDILCG